MRNWCTAPNARPAMCVCHGSCRSWRCQASVPLSVQHWNCLMGGHSGEFSTAFLNIATFQKAWGGLCVARFMHMQHVVESEKIPDRGELKPETMLQPQAATRKKCTGQAAQHTLDRRLPWSVMVLLKHHDTCTAPAMDPPGNTTAIHSRHTCATHAVGGRRSAPPPDSSPDTATSLSTGRTHHSARSGHP